jgi:tetratricopeptide (TPR) repeat protein
MRVEPIGTIIMCFAHIDEETRTILQSIMAEAENFGDFTERLCNRVCEEPSSPLPEYFAFYFAFWLDWYTLVDKLESAGKVSDLAWHLLLLSRARRGEAVSWDDSRRSVKRALIAAPNDWIASHLYLVWRLIAEDFYPETDIDIQPIEAIASSVEKNKEMACFKSYLLFFKARKYDREGRVKESVGLYRQVLATAREFDDQTMVADTMLTIAGNIKQTDVKQAIDLFISSRELCQKLGYKLGVGSVQLNLGFIMQFRGELSAAIEYLLDYKAIREQLGLPMIWHNSYIASVYNQFGKGEEAYQYAKTAVDFSQTSSIIRPFPRMHAELAWALVNLGRYDEAYAELATAYGIASKSGDSGQMMWVRLVDGILDKAEKHFDSANLIFKEILKDLESSPIPVFQNICLLNLTEIEIELLTDEWLKKNSDVSGPWMTRLVEHAEKNDLPGIAARALLLKAELRRRQGRLDEVRMTLKEVQKTANAPSMKYLNDLAVSMFPEIIIT